MARILIILFSSFVLFSCTGQQNALKCEERRCDTLDTYMLTQFCKDNKIEHNITYVDTAFVDKCLGDIQFSAWICADCKGYENADLLTQNNLVIRKLRIDYNGGIKSEKVKLSDLTKYYNQTISLKWTRGKIIYIKFK